MSKICMTLSSSNGTWLKDCLQPQHYYVSITLDDPNGEILARVCLSYEQAAKMLLYNGDVECTLERYRDKHGKLVSEEVEPPPSVHQRMKERLKETHESLAKRLEDVKRDVYEMLNGGKTNKTNLTNLLRDIETIQSHYNSNENFVVQQAEEELGSMQNNAAGQLGLFLQTHGIEVAKEEIKKMIPTGTPLALPDKATPVEDHYSLKDREDKPIEQMTALEVSDLIHFLFKKFEKQQPKDKENVHLFQANSSATSSFIYVKYISYQGSHKLTLEEAKKYLSFLMSIKNVSQFKNHWQYKK